MRKGGGVVVRIRRRSELNDQETANARRNANGQLHLGSKQDETAQRLNSTSAWISYATIIARTKRGSVSRLKREQQHEARSSRSRPLSNIQVSGVVETVQRPVTPFPQLRLLLRKKSNKQRDDGGGENIVTTCPTKLRPPAVASSKGRQ
jgi:hypothetical protein